MHDPCESNSTCEADLERIIFPAGDSALCKQVSAQLLALLSTFAANGQCEKTSYDDFYLEVHSSSSAEVVPQGCSASAGEGVHCSSSDADIQQGCSTLAGEAVHVVGGTSLATLPAILQQAVQVGLGAQYGFMRAAGNHNRRRGSLSVLFISSRSFTGLSEMSGILKF